MRQAKGPHGSGFVAAGAAANGQRVESGHAADCTSPSHRSIWSGTDSAHFRHAASAAADVAAGVVARLSSSAPATCGSVPRAARNTPAGPPVERRHPATGSALPQGVRRARYRGTAVHQRAAGQRRLRRGGTLPESCTHPMDVTHAGGQIPSMRPACIPGMPTGMSTPGAPSSAVSTCSCRSPADKFDPHAVAACGVHRSKPIRSACGGLVDPARRLAGFRIGLGTA